MLELSRGQKYLINLGMKNCTVSANGKISIFLEFLIVLVLISISAKGYVSGLSVGPSTKALVQGQLQS